MKKSEWRMIFFENIILMLNLLALSAKVIEILFGSYEKIEGLIETWERITIFLKWDTVTDFEIRFAIFILIPLYFLAKTKVKRISGGQYQSVVSFTAHLISKKNQYWKKDRMGLGLISANYIFLWIAFFYEFIMKMIQ